MEGDRLGDGETEGDNDGDKLGERDGEGLTEGLTLGEILGDNDGEGETLGEILGERLGLSEGLRLGDGLTDGETDGDKEGEGDPNVMFSFILRKELFVPKRIVAVPLVIVPTLVANTRRRIRSPAANAVSVTFAIHAILVSAIESNSTPSSNGPPPSSVIVGVPGVYL